MPICDLRATVTWRDLEKNACHARRHPLMTRSSTPRGLARDRGSESTCAHTVTHGHSLAVTHGVGNASSKRGFETHTTCYDMLRHATRGTSWGTAGYQVNIELWYIRRGSNLVHVLARIMGMFQIHVSMRRQQCTSIRQRLHPHPL